MLRINLLQMKSKGAATGGLADMLEPLGLSDISAEDLIEYRSIFFKVVFIAIGMYLGVAIPDHLLQERIAELDAQIEQKNQELGKLRRELRSKQSIREEMKAVTARETEIKRKLAVISSLDQDRYSAFRVMDTVSLLIPKEVWIKNIDFNASTLKLRGECWEFIPINEFVASLRQSPLFTNVRLVAINSRPAPSQIDGVPKSLQKIKSFEVEITINRDLGKKKEKA